MKKAVIASLLAVASTTFMGHYAVGQAAPVNLGQGADAPLQLPPAEANAFNAASSAATPQARAQGLESFLTSYPTSQAKNLALEGLLAAYMQFDQTKIIPAADKLLAAEPNNVQALTMEAALLTPAAQQMPDGPQKQAALDAAAAFGEKGLVAIQTKPKDMSDADYANLKSQAIPYFYSAIGSAALNKKDTAAAIEAFKKELAAATPAMTQAPGVVLIDTFQLGQAYRQATPPDLVNCTFYTARASNFAPDGIKQQMLQTSKYCYNKFHGKMDGFEAVQAAAAANLNPPADFKIDPAPSPADLAHDALKGTDPSTLALADREFILANGSKTDDAGVKDSDKVWATMKGKSFTIPDALVIASTPTQLQVAVSDDAVQNKVADITVQIKPMTAPDEPKAKTVAAMAKYHKEKADFDAYTAATAVGGKVTFSGTYDTYTTTPTLMINMSDGEVVLPKAAAAKAPAHAAPAHRPAARK